MAPFLRLTDLDLHQKRVLIREDLNVPIEQGHIMNDARIRAALPTLRYAWQQGAAVVILSHLGRPEEGKLTPALSLAPVAERLQQLLGQPVRFVEHWIDGFPLTPGDIVLCENVRFERGEKENDPSLAKKMAQLGDIFVMDAFATAHRCEASTVGVAEFSKQCCAGLLLSAELQALSRALHDPARPLLSIVGGAKIASKLPLLESLIEKSNVLILGGGIANTFLAAQGFSLGTSLVEKELIPTAQRLLALAEEKQVTLALPEDGVMAKEVSATAIGKIKKITEMDEDDKLLDTGPLTNQRYQRLIHAAATILWNGPVGVFELPNFEMGTRVLSQTIANSQAFSIAGGGDTLAAIEKYGIRDKLSYVSTGGGAFLEFVEGRPLPGLQALQTCTKNS